MQTMKITAKRRKLALFIAVIMALTLWTAVPLTASADDPVDEATNLTYSISGGEATITGYAGDKAALTTIEIPATVGDDIPVTAIGLYAVVDCVALTSITVADGQNNFSAAGGVLFNADKSTLIRYPLNKAGSYKIPESVTTLAPVSFYQCAGLTGLTVPATVTTIGNYAFNSCFGLGNVTIEPGVTSIGNGMFNECKALTSITIPASVQSVGYYAFQGCSELSDVIILTRNATFSNGIFDAAPKAKIWCYAGSSAATTYYTSKAKLLVDGIKLSKASLSLEIDEDETPLTVDGYLPANQDEIEAGVDDPAVTWHSSNPAIAAVDEDGNVEAKANGTALITATITPPKSGIPVTGTCEVTVVPDDAEPGDLYSLTVMSGKFDALNIAGAKMSIVADAAPSDQAFDEWTGIDDSLFTNETKKNSPSAIFAMPAENITVTATYKTVYALTMVKGTDNLDVGLYAAGDVVSITAETPESGKVFDTWTSEPDGVVFTNANSPTTTFAMPGNPVTVTATYTDAPPPPPAPTTYVVTVNGGTGGASYEAGATVSITANAPADGKVFDTWTSNDSVTFADPTSASTTFTMPAKAVSVTATYKDDPKDSDGDGVPDYVEEQEGTDPADSCDFKDTDEDGVPDYVETKDGTNPNDKNSFKDTNSDGIPDYVQEHPAPVTETNGWVYANGMWKFFIDDVAQTGWLYDDAWYYLDADGIMQTGWLYDGGIWYYLAGNGAMKTGWVKDDGNWYYLKGNGAMVASKWLKDTDGSWYYLAGNGKMLTGKQSIGNKAYSFKASGAWIG